MRIQSPKKRESSRRSNENPVAEEKDFVEGQENKLWINATSLEKRSRRHRSQKKNFGKIGHAEEISAALDSRSLETTSFDLTFHCFRHYQKPRLPAAKPASPSCLLGSKPRKQHPVQNF
jgi:hypothetical protein